MTEPDQQRATADDPAAPGVVPAPRAPVPDLGFFAGAPQPGGSQFGGTPQLGQATLGQVPFGGPTVPAPAPRASGGSAWKIAVAGAAVVLLLVSVFGGRFAWQQFVADPVLPETLGGMPRIVDAQVEQQMLGAQEGLAGELSSGSTVKAALYSDRQGTGYMLFAVRGGSGGDDAAGADPFTGWTKTETGGTTCYSKPAQASAGFGVTMCLHGFWRRAVIVMGMGATPPDATVVAGATDEAWDAQ